MGLIATLQNATDKLFTVLDDLVGPLSLRKITSSAYDPSTGSVLGTELDHTFIGTFIDVSDSGFNNSLVELGDRVVYMKAISVDPDVGDKIVDTDGLEFTIVHKMDISAYGTTFAWQLLVRL